MSAVQKLDLRPGEWVEVRSAVEIFSTLDDAASLDNLPFMPEMLPLCGRRFKVYKRADRTCDPVSLTGLFRRMQDTVHLETARCDGSSHGGCQAECLMFWKEAWLRRVPDGAAQFEPKSSCSASEGGGPTARDLVWLQSTAHRAPTPEGEPCYRCQATQLHKATGPLPWWRPTQYLRDVFANDVPLKDVVFGLAVVALSKFRMKLTGRPFPNILGTLKRTPVENLHLQIGEWVVVKSREEIMKTLDTQGRNRGMTFESEMIPYCGKPYRVMRRVEKIIDETSGRMKQLSGVSVILENVICAGVYRRACPRANYLYWREIWLRRAEPHEQPSPSPCAATATCALAQANGPVKAEEVKREIFDEDDTGNDHNDTKITKNH